LAAGAGARPSPRDDISRHRRLLLLEIAAQEASSEARVFPARWLCAVTVHAADPQGAR
jgi:hypothetical protein